ncbi:MAG: hypothetical protein ABUT39_10780 [Acidobacteriota bacterium]
MRPLDFQPPPDSDRRERDPREPFQPPAEKDPERREEPIEDPADAPAEGEPERRDPTPPGRPPLEVSA